MRAAGINGRTAHLIYPADGLITLLNTVPTSFLSGFWFSVGYSSELTANLAKISAFCKLVFKKHIWRKHLKLKIVFYESVDWQLDIVFLHNLAESMDKQKINLV